MRFKIEKLEHADLPKILEMMVKHGYSVELYHDGVAWNITITNFDNKEDTINVYDNDVMGATLKLLEHLEFENDKLKISKTYD